MTYINMRYEIRPGPPAAPLGPIYLRPGTTDALVYMQVWNEELYRPVMGLRDYALIIDGGANIGMSALYFHQHHPNATVIAIEPDISNCGVLVQNATPVKEILRFHAALGVDYCDGRMIDPGLGAFGMQVETDEDGDVRVMPIDAFLRYSQRVDYGNGDVTTVNYPSRPCLVKLDIEGAEVECFKDPAWMHDIDVLAVELHGSNAELGLTEALHVVGRRHRRWTVGETTFVEFL